MITVTAANKVHIKHFPPTCVEDPCLRMLTRDGRRRPEQLLARRSCSAEANRDEIIPAAIIEAAFCMLEPLSLSSILSGCTWAQLQIHM